MSEKRTGRSGEGTGGKPLPQDPKGKPVGSAGPPDSQEPPPVPQSDLAYYTERYPLEEVWPPPRMARRLLWLEAECDRRGEALRELQGAEEVQLGEIGRQQERINELEDALGDLEDMAGHRIRCPASTTLDYADCTCAKGVARALLPQRGEQP